MAEAPSDNNALCSALRVFRGDVLNPNSLHRSCFVFCPTPTNQFVVSQSSNNYSCSNLYIVSLVCCDLSPSVLSSECLAICKYISLFSYFTAVKLNKLGLLYGISVQLHSV